LDRETFLADKHICAVTLERALNVAMTGLSSRSGSLLALQLFNLAPAAPIVGIGAGELACTQALFAYTMSQPRHTCGNELEGYVRRAVSKYDRNFQISNKTV
jgi:hypothetical protein